MSVLDRKLLRDFRRSTALLLAIISIIAVGVSCQVAMTSTYYNLKLAQSSYYAACRMADFWIDLKKAPHSEIDALAELPGVTAIRARIQFLATVDLENTPDVINGMVLSLPRDPDAVINGIVLKRGGYFTDTRDNEVIVDDAFARQHAVHPGDWVHLLLNNRRQELFVVGTAQSSEFAYLLQPGGIAPDPKHFGVFYIKRRYAEDVFDFEGAANQVVGLLAPEVREQSGEFLRQAELLLEPYGVFSAIARRDQASHRYLDNEIKGLAAFSVVMPMIFLTVAALVLNVLMNRLVDQQRVIIGTLKALGYDNRQVFAHFMKHALAVGFVGGVIGCLLGYVLAYAMTSEYERLFEFPRLDNAPYPPAYAIGLAISLLCAVAGAVQATRAALRLHPAEAMRPKPPKRGGKIALERLHALWRRLSFEWRMVLRSVFRSRVRTAASLFATMMGSALLMCGFMSIAAIFYLIDFQFRLLLRSDVDLNFRDERGVEALWESRQLPGVDYAEGVLNVSCHFEHGPFRRRGAITGIAPDARLTVPRDTRGDPLRVPTAGLAMTQAMADVLHVNRGDMLTIRPVKGLREPKRVPVMEIADSFLGLGVYADIDYLSGLINESYAVSGTQLLVDPRPEAKQMLYRTIKELPVVQSVGAREESIRNLNETIMKNLWVSILIIVLFAGVIFFGSILNASLVGLAERQREVATLRVLGYTPWQVGNHFLRENLLINAAGTLLGLPLGYLLTLAIAWSYNNELIRLPVVAPTWSWWATMATGIAFGLLAHACIQWVIVRTNWFAALNVKE